jgi:osmotically-inducible protein OsmY
MKFVSVYVIGLLLLPAGVFAQTPADNTKVNERDRQPSQVTADQQPNNRSDLETTRQIRKTIVAEKSFSTYGHNVKIVTKGGKVTLRGPVRSEDEKKMLEAKATAVAGVGNVMNELTVMGAVANPTPAVKSSDPKAGK